MADLGQGARIDLSPIGGKSQADAAELLSVGTATLDRARKVLKDGIPELVAAVERGEVPARIGRVRSCWNAAHAGGNGR